MKLGIFCRKLASVGSKKNSFHHVIVAPPRGFLNNVVLFSVHIFYHSNLSQNNAANVR